MYWFWLLIALRQIQTTDFRSVIERSAAYAAYCDQESSSNESSNYDDDTEQESTSNESVDRYNTPGDALLQPSVLR